jgi:hypothetical protein
MKKLSIFFVFAVLALGFVSALYEPNKQVSTPMEGEARITGVEGSNNPGSTPLAASQKTALQKGEFMNEMGQTMRIQGEANQIRLQVGEHIANCSECNLTQEKVQNKTRIYAQLSNGKQAQIKVMPDVASKVAIQRLGMNNCENCSIDLKEVGKGNSTKMAYEVRTKAPAKVLGLFKTQVETEVEIDVETGEIIKTKKPWWAILQASE